MFYLQKFRFTFPKTKQKGKRGISRASGTHEPVRAHTPKIIHAHGEELAHHKPEQSNSGFQPEGT